MTRTSEAAPVERLIELYKTMLLIRAVESTLARVFADGEVPGFIHLSIGQEAVAAGIASVMLPDDTLATTHRGHGHVLAKGLDLGGFFKEIMGRAGGVCQGRGGSMHVADMRLGIIGANGIVGAGIPIAMGSALAFKTRATRDVAVAMFGDGAMAEGVLHESLNFAKLLQLPLLLVCENNGWSEFSPTSKQFGAALSDLARAFGVPHRIVNGNDAVLVAAAAQAAIDQVRGGGGPCVLECTTHRARGHFEGDTQQYRDPAELSSSIEKDPLQSMAAALRAMSVDDASLRQLQADADHAVASALQQAREDAQPDYDAAYQDVYTRKEA